MTGESGLPSRIDESLVKIGAWEGALVIDKPAGPTSHDVVDRVREICGTRRVGHTGTLDPFATGVLAVCIGSATRLARFLSAGPKVYRARIRLGVSTTTDDCQGEPIGDPRSVSLRQDEVESACRALTGSLKQVPPAFSAKRVDGRRAYALARRGEPVSPAAVDVTIEDLRLESMHDGTIDLLVTCSPGTYVRALARDLGDMLGTGGHLTALRRLRSGEFDIEQAVSWAEIGARVVDRVIPLSRLLAHWPSVTVGEQGAVDLGHGRAIERSMTIEGFPLDPPERLRAVDRSGRLLAIVRPAGFGLKSDELPVEPRLHPEIVLAAGSRR
ncbi:MAG: tRNA pseudouridine(55) synthase TruB [Vicinamibacteria bacterium]|nr:tRNA pseudouridine(55) synthase TruB [Vicinamibacteria bacterium]